MSAAESTPPRGPLSKLRRNKGLANDSTTSLSAPVDGDDSSAGGGLKASMEDAVGKLKDKAGRRKSVDDRSTSTVDEGGGSRRLTKLLPRSRKKDGLSPQRIRSGDLRTGSLLEIRSHSQTSLLDDSGHSSLLTDDTSDAEGYPPRPTLSPHQSHSGLLTLSSPEINAQARPVATVNSTSPSDSTTSVPQIIEPTGSSLPPPRLTNPSPSPSRLGKFFRPRSRAGSVGSQTPNQLGEGAPEELLPDPEVSSPSQQHSPAPSVKSVPELPQIAPIRSDARRPETPDQLPPARISTTSLPATPPNFVETPTTLVTPPTPTDPSRDSGTFPDRKLTGSPPKRRSLNSVESIRHRRAQSSNLPSKLSNSIPAPLTPTVEETKTPGGTLTQPTSATGFFSSFFSAAQKAADQLSSNINTSAAAQGKSKAIAVEPDEGGEEVIPGTQSVIDTVEENKDRRPATETLGKGNLSLSQLGITEDDESTPMGSTVDLPQQTHTGVNGDRNKKAEEEAAARAVSVAYEKPMQNAVSQATGRPVSVSSTDRLTLDQAPSRSGADPLQRSGSVRSKLSGRRRRHRASSATTATEGGMGTLAAAIKSSSAAIANPATGGQGHRLTGFAVASNKRNKDFHSLFRSVPEDDYLIEDYSAALQKDILLHGRLYVSEGHICFSSNILGWVTNLVIGFDEVVSVEKKSTAVIFPNAIVIQTLQARNTFASFVARDSTYELLIGIWKISHPNLKSSLNGVTLDDAGTGDKTEVADPEASDVETGDGTDDEVYDEDEDDDDVGSFTDAGKAPSMAGSDIGEQTLSRKTSSMPLAAPAQPNGAPTKTPEAAEAVVSAIGGSSAPGPQTHAPTECSDQANHYDRPLTDTTIPAPLGKIYSLIYGPESSTFMRKWFVDDQKSRDLNWSENYLSQDNKTVVFDYIKPINAPVGPKQTKCITTNTLVDFDLERAVTVDCSTATPDVPSGGAFTTKTRYCLMWGPNNSTRMIANCTIEWTGKSWLKGPIEKGANDGQIEYVKALVAALKAAVSAKAPIKSANGKKLKRKGTKSSDIDVAVVPAAVVGEAKASDWGLLEPLHQILEPLISIVRPFVTSETIIAVLFCLLMYTWMTQSRSSGTSMRHPDYASPDRLAAYEEIWRREEGELWSWLEDRTGANHLYTAPESSGHGGEARQKVLREREMGRQLQQDERMSERQMDDAIRVTEEKLEALKRAVAKRKKGAHG
ncbi:glucosyltransferase, myotubularin and putative membrane-associated protein domain protein [Teratosphaeria destructans]|uniref:Glucosyltransferase, myotubularin and putative membrane-associated protein domain protein n=1 Tax=Teratosphaeria destructans TaxID=418781 RepID=A0A9W7SS95_9PEZI|nr:glucosyltransferase, myotubularin and putative membrane-associated protein domain protein [Teratosphaeria destructans]